MTAGLGEQQRTLVPSQREGGAGDEVTTGATAPEGPPPSRRSLRTLLREMDPRIIVADAPALPLVVLGLFGFVSQWDDAAVGLLLPDMRRDFATDVGFLLSLQAFVSLLSLLIAPWLGWLADRRNRVRMLRVGAVISNASTLGTGFATSIPALVAGRAGALGGAAVIQPVGFPLLTDYYPSRVRARMFAFLTATGYLGAVAGPIIAGNLAVTYGWRAAIVVLAVVALGATALTFLLREPVRGYQDRIEAGADEDVARRGQPPASWGEGWRAARSITTIRRLWYTAPFITLMAFGTLGVMGFYYTDEFGVGPQGRGYISAGGFLAGLAAVLVAGVVGDRWLRERPGRIIAAMSAVFLAQGVAFVLVAVSPVLWLSIAINMTLAFLNVFFLPSLYTLLSVTVPARIRGLGIQTVQQWLALGSVAVPALFALADAAGIRAVLLALAPISVVAAAISASSVFGVARDIRAARAAATAEEDARRAREAGRAKLLVCRDVDVAYDGVQVLFGVDFDVAEGEIVALLGTNGAGKSTLLRAIAGITEASNGAVGFDGRDITHLPPHEIAAAGIAFVPGGRAIFPALTVAENLRTAAWLDPDAATIGARVEEVLDTFPALRPRLDEQAGNLSGGEQQMLALGQTFLMRPRLLMIDELSLGLAPAVVEQLVGILRRIHEGGTTIVLVEQSVNLAMTIADRAVFMEKGEVRFTGPTAELLHRGDVMRSVFLGGAAGGALTAVPGRRARVEPGELLLHAEGLHVRFGGVAALDGAGIDVRAREIVGIIGPNGAGKTTLFDALSGSIRVDDGRIELDGNDVTGLEPYARARMGLARSFQTARLFPTMTAREAIVVALERQLAAENPLTAAAWLPSVRTAERRAARRADQLIELLGLGRWADAFVSELSTATRRIVDIACVMAFEPRVLLLDEPSSGLAQAETEELGPLLERLVRETGCGLAIIEHDIPLVTSVSDRMIAMDLGRVLVEGPPEEVVAHPGVVRAYLGTDEDVIARSGARG